MDLREAVDDAVTHAVGRAHRDDEILEHTGGPAGNARLTAWTGLVLLALFCVELFTLIDVRGLISWHIVVGILLIPPALVKTATTGWRIARYYAGDRPYRAAGPPPLLLRLLGPLVVVTTLAVLGSGVALILMSPDSARQGLVTLGSFHLSTLMIHKASFVLWAGATGLHTLGRVVPAVSMTVTRAARSVRVPGRGQRGLVLGGMLAVAVVAATLALSLAAPWHDRGSFGSGDDRHHTHDH